MKKKETVKVKHSPSKVKKNKEVKTTGGRVLQMKNRPQAKQVVKVDPVFAQAVQSYQDGLRCLQERKFERARNLFLKAIAGKNPELADRAALHLSTCNQHLERATNVFKSPEEHYDYAISLINVGDYVAAREHLEKILKQAPKADYVCYGLAVLDCLTGHTEESLKHLDDAIRLNPSNRFQARNDSDFRNLADDPRFTELLYPEPGTEQIYSASDSPGYRR